MEETSESSVVTHKIPLDLASKEAVRVLHVDDDQGFLKIAKTCLEMQGGLQVETASCVEEAMDKMKEKDFDVIISDYQIPGKDGLQFLKELREKGNTVPFIIFTGKGREEVAVKALNLGADYYIDKHADPETLCTELAHDIQIIVGKKRAERQLRHNSWLLQNINDAIIVTDENLRITSWNHVAETLYGWKAGEVLGRSVLEVLRRASPSEPDTQEILQTLSKEGSMQAELVHLDKTGKQVYIEANLTQLRDENGRIKGYIAVVHDISEHHAMVETLKQRESTYRTLAENVPAVVYRVLLQENMRMEFFNNMVQSMTGYALDKLKRGTVCSIDPLIVPEDRARVVSTVEQAVKTNKPFTVEYRIRHKNGSIHQFYEQGRPITDNSGKPLYIDGVIFDMTEQRKMAEDLAESEAKYRGLVESAAVPIGTSDLKGRFTYVNKALAELLGYTVQEMAGQPFKNFLHPKDKGKITRQFLKIIILRRDPRSFEFRALHKDGHAVNLMSKPTRFILNGKTVGFQAIMVDITEIKKITEELQRFSSAVKTSQDSIVISDINGKIIDANETTLKMYGTTDKQDLIGASAFDIIAPEDQEKAIEGMKEVLSKGSIKNREYTTLTKTGGKVISQMSITLMKDDKNKPTGFVGIIRDISQRKKIEHEILESQQKFERLFMKNPEPAVHLNPDFHILNINPRFTALFRYTLNEIQGKHIDDTIVPKEKQQEAKTLNEKAADGYVYYDTVRRKKDGSLIPVSVSAAPITIGNQNFGYIGMYKDISLLKKTEQELANMNEKLRVVGGLTRHDAKNKLSVIVGNTYLARKKLPPNSEALQYLEEIDNSVRQVTEIFDFAKAYEMLGSEELTYIDVERTVEEAILLLSDLKGAKMINDCRGLTVSADTLLRQLFYNLIDNSLKHGQKVSRIRISYRKTNQDQLKLIYDDDGIGITHKEKPKLFTEGFTTGKGSGYGLFLIKKITEVYGWAIQETGEPNKGAQFTITIPKTSQNLKTNYKTL